MQFTSISGIISEEECKDAPHVSFERVQNFTITFASKGRVGWHLLVVTSTSGAAIVNSASTSGASRGVLRSTASAVLSGRVQTRDVGREGRDGLELGCVVCHGAGARAVGVLGTAARVTSSDVRVTASSVGGGRGGISCCVRISSRTSVRISGSVGIAATSVEDVVVGLRGRGVAGAITITVTVTVTVATTEHGLAAFANRNAAAHPHEENGPYSSGDEEEDPADDELRFETSAGACKVAVRLIALIQQARSNILHVQQQRWSQFNEKWGAGRKHSTPERERETARRRRLVFGSKKTTSLVF